MVSVNDFSEEFIELLRAAHESIPFKRVSIPSHLIERYNKIYGKEDGIQLTASAFTVDKSFEITEESLWTLMLESRDLKKKSQPLDFGDFKWRTTSGAPVARKSAHGDAG